MVKATVKWGKESYDVEVDAASAASDFKLQLFSLTGVPPERQKLMSKAWKGILKDDVALSTCTLSDGMIVTLMGSSEGVTKPTEAAVFVEDLPQHAIVGAGHALPAGLQNNQNTCYANSTLEALRYVPELKDALTAYKAKHGGAAAPPGASEIYQQLLAAMGAASGGAGGAGAGAGGAGGGASAFSRLNVGLADLYQRLDASPSPLLPMGFLTALRSAFPQFGETGAGGGYKQQDTEEFHGAMMTALAAELKEATPAVPALRPAPAGTDGASNVIDTLFGVELEVEYKCRETDAEPPVVQREFSRKLVCNIEGGAGRTTQINTVNEGVMLGLTGEVEKRSELLGRNAVWSRVSRVVSLPKYLCVHFLRFYWKPTPDSRDHTGVKCKMLRPVTFPADNFDVYEFCTARLQHKLRALRAKHGDAVPAAPKAIADASSSAAGGSSSSSSSAAAGPGSAAAPTAAVAPSAAPSASAMDEDDDLAAALRMSMDGAAAASAGSSMAVDGAKPAAAASASSAVSPSGDEPVGFGVPESFRGFYELFAIVTHKGRSADSGHYIAWVRRSATGSTVPGDKDKWLVFDDDTISEVTTEFVVGMLKGGGDEHMAYLTFYRAKA